MSVAKLMAPSFGRSVGDDLERLQIVKMLLNWIGIGRNRPGQCCHEGGNDVSRML